MNTTKPVIKSPTTFTTKRYQHLRTEAESATTFESSTAAQKQTTANMEMNNRRDNKFNC